MVDAKSEMRVFQKKEEVFECVGLKATPRVDALSKLTMPLSGVWKVFRLIQEKYLDE